MPVKEITDTNDLYVAEDETFGGLEDEFGPSFLIVLRNLLLNSAALRPSHVDILRERVTPELKKPVFIAEIYAMTDRSGSKQLNYKVAADRLGAVQNGLLPFGAPFAKFHHDFCKAIGEDYFASRHDRDPANPVYDDGKREERFRSVVVALSPAPIGIQTRVFRSSTVANVLAFCRMHSQTA
jgi:hypothetical protein